MDSRLDQGLDWQQCARDTRVSLQPFTLGASADRQATILVSADSAEASIIEDVGQFSGNVELQQGEQRIFAEQIGYAWHNGELDASGQVLLQRPDLRVSANRVAYNLVTHSGSAEQAQYRLPGIMARGSAARIEFSGADTNHFQDITYTTCGPDKSDWLLSAERLEIDRAEGLGTAHQARLSFLGTAVAWVPKLTFPVDDRRRSGLLVPTLGLSDKQGFDASLPYYLNLAPNYDLTLTPRVMSRRGAMLSGQFRFLSHTTEGEISADFLPHDSLSNTDSNNRDTRVNIIVLLD